MEILVGVFLILMVAFAVISYPMISTARNTKKQAKEEGNYEDNLLKKEI